MKNVVVGTHTNTVVAEAGDNDKILTVLSNNGFSKTEQQSIKDLQGNTYSGGELIEDGKTYLLVENMKSGN